jgi:hypothetical protein
MKKQSNKANRSKKTYAKPQIQKHKALALISGSGGDGDDCNLYNSRRSGIVYYH